MALPAAWIFLESGKTLNDLRPTDAIIRGSDHTCAPPAP
jgi:hypothetical protein